MRGYHYPLVAVPLHLEYAGHHSCALLAVPPGGRPATLGHPQEMLGGRFGELQVGKLQGQVEVVEVCSVRHRLS